ncbi:MAG: hypothetical protein ONB05_03015, partial [candidate division KSB1 bacterium]|nr:hypothetical protein [candidate division KSB1 bacterium]
MKGLSFCLLILIGLGLVPQVWASPTRADAIVLVNSSSPNYTDYLYDIKPYLDQFGVPVRVVLDVSQTPIPLDIGDYALIIIGHREMGLPPGTPQTYLSNAVQSGSGLVNFDNALATGNNTPRYPYLQDIFGFAYQSANSVNSITIVTTDSYITALHTPNETISFFSSITPLGLATPVPAAVRVLVQAAGQPFLLTTTYGAGRAVQWASYDWMRQSVKGPVFGLDDLVWRSLVWAASKPFVLQALPPFVTLRVDDAWGNGLGSGTSPFEFVNIARSYGFKPWLGLFINLMSEAAISELQDYIEAGDATASIHSFTWYDFFYYDHNNQSNFSDAIMANHYANANSWYISHSDFPKSKVVIPHFYEIGTNAFDGLVNWDIQFVNTVLTPGLPYGSSAPMSGPYHLYETPPASDGHQYPIYYADYLTIPGHPEYDGRFFNVIFEPRDLGGEWSPNNNVSQSVEQGVQILRRAFDSMVLATLFTHEGDYIRYLTANTWEAILSGVTSQIASYNPTYVTLDYACQYIRAMYHSHISESTWEPFSGEVRTILAGNTDMDTKFYLFTGVDEDISHEFVDVPAFNGSTVVTYTITPAGADTTGPVISEVGMSNVASSSATISWRTDEASDSQVEYGLSTSYGSLTPLDGAMVT